MGILPGEPISVVQSFPSYVFQVGQTQFAVDRQIAESIYIRLYEEEAAVEGLLPKVHAKSGRRLGWGHKPR
jgi:hypothetical protein